jgi:hypothetical protein
MIDSVVVLRSILEVAFYVLVISSFKRIRVDDARFSAATLPRLDYGRWRRQLFCRRREPVVSYLEPLNGVLSRATPIGLYNGKTIHQAIALESGDCYQFDRISPVAREQMSKTGAFTIQLASDEYVDGAGIIYRRM